jgi:hypothetical protein
MRRIAFFSGLVLGSGVCAWILGAALTYLYTGKFPAIQTVEGGQLRLGLVDLSTLYETQEIVPETAAMWGEEG